MPNENDCSDSTEYSSFEKSQAHQDSSSQDEAHHCICSLSCHNLFVSFNSSESNSPMLMQEDLLFNHIQNSYQKVLISFDKPPLI
jgi:hypothetical protein